MMAYRGQSLEGCLLEQDEDRGKSHAVVEIDHELVKYMFPDVGAHILE